jgi:hypothetical protein
MTRRIGCRRRPPRLASRRPRSLRPVRSASTLPNPARMMERPREASLPPTLTSRCHAAAPARGGGVPFSVVCVYAVLCCMGCCCVCSCDCHARHRTCPEMLQCELQGQLDSCRLELQSVKIQAASYAGELEEVPDDVPRTLPASLAPRPISAAGSVGAALGVDAV